MSARPHVALVGFMAAGKTTIGRHLATELGLPFIDTDDLIVARHGPIADVFRRRGEAGFRALEYEAVLAALGTPAAVIALGGGAVTHPATRRVLGERALRVYLDIPVEALVRRLVRSKTVRPVLGTQPTEESVRALLAAREDAYLDSDIVVSGPRRSKRAFALEIVQRLREHSTNGSES